jgi:hypothetical protein
MDLAATTIRKADPQEDGWVSRGHEAWIAWPMAPVMAIYAVAVLWSFYALFSVMFTSSACEASAVAANRIAQMRDIGVPVGVTKVLVGAIPTTGGVDQLIDAVYTNPMFNAMTPASIETGVSTVCALGIALKSK